MNLNDFYSELEQLCLKHGVTMDSFNIHQDSMENHSIILDEFHSRAGVQVRSVYKADVQLQFEEMSIHETGQKFQNLNYFSKGELNRG